MIKIYLNVLIKAAAGFIKYLIQGKLHKLTRANIKGYFQGLTRLEKFKVNKLTHYTQTEQFYFRLATMDPECIQKGQCPCQCEVPAKQLEYRSCEKECYPPMMNIEEWDMYKREKRIGPSSMRTMIKNAKNVLELLHIK